MKTTLFDIIDRWTLEWDRTLVDLVLTDVSTHFYERGFVLLILEDLWDILEMADDPFQYMTQERKVAMVERLLLDPDFEEAAMSIEVEILEGPEHRIVVLNADQVISEKPELFEEYEADM